MSKPANTGGHPTALTKDIEAKILAARRIGARAPLIARHTGIHVDTLYNWLRWGNPDWNPDNASDKKHTPKDRTPYFRFFLKWREATAVPDMVANNAWVKAAAKGDWRAGKEWLTAHHPQEYASDSVHHSGNVTITPGRAIADLFDDVLSHLDLTDQQRAAIPEAIRKALPQHEHPED